MQLVDFFRSRRGGELVGIVVMAIGISLAAALLTYHPRDSSAFYTSTETEIRNAIGYYGATLAWIFVGFFGFASLLFPAAPADKPPLTFRRVMNMRAQPTSK